MAEENKQSEVPPLVQPGVPESYPGSSGSKKEWPEVVGFTPEEAEMKIRVDMPMVQFQVVPPNHFVTMDYNLRRVRLFLDSDGKVARPPRIG
ncbi:hypothetical protein Sjap_013512 [Stephania japonica]|uniref:Subtilisin inhibitor 1 n=1 Tax=Stephania japonica TaxID=461633 RepID=A0AAP0NZZ9_9MAGN